MTISPQGYRLLLEDPTALAGTPPRSIKEDLIVHYLFEREIMNDKFIAEVKAPACPKTTKFLQGLADSIDFYLRLAGHITDSKLEEELVEQAKKHTLSYDKAKKALNDYKDYYQFLLAKENKRVVKPTSLNDIESLGNSISGRYSNLLRGTAYHNRVKQVPLSEVQSGLFTAFNFINESDTPVVEYAIDSLSSSRLLLRNKQIIIEDFHTEMYFDFCFDLINHDTTNNAITVGLIRVSDKKLPEIKEDNPFWFDVIMAKTIIASLMANSKKYTLDIQLIVIDKNNCHTRILFTSDTLDIYEKKFQETLKEIYPIVKSGIPTYPGFIKDFIQL